MAWTNLQEEVLEQFADVSWNGMHMRALSTSSDGSDGFATYLPDGLVSISENDNWQITARKSDDAFTVRVRDVCTEKLVWRARALAAAAGDDTFGAAIAVGRVLVKTPGWIKINNTWLNKPGVLALCSTKAKLVVGDIAKITGAAGRTVAACLREAGWTVARKTVNGPTTQVMVWTRPEMSAVGAQT